MAAAAACIFNGKSVASGASVAAYQAASVAHGQSCVSQSRVCTNGVLSGSYANASCSVAAAASVSGSCGTANGLAAASAPASNLCSAGTASSVTGTGPFLWACAGINGGSAASCSAPLAVSSSGAFPNAANTGYAPSGQVLGPQQGDIKISTPGTYTGLNATSIRITVSNVTIQRSLIAASNFNLILIEQGLSGIVIQDSELIGGGIAGNIVGQNGINVYGGGSVTIRRCNIHEIGSGVSIGEGPLLLQDNYIHDLNGSSDTHYNGIQDNGSTNPVDIEHNSILNQNDWTDAVMIDNQFGPVKNITVNNNYLTGGDFTLYIDGSLTPSNSITAVTVTNNRMTSGQYGYFLTRDFTNILVQGNTDYVTGQPAN